MTEDTVFGFVENAKSHTFEVTDVDGSLFTGRLVACASSADNEPDPASISLQQKGYSVELFVNEIQSIKEI